MGYATVRTDLMSGTKQGTDLVSLKYYVVDGQTSTPTAIENAHVVKLDGLLTGEKQVYKAVVPARDTALRDVVLVATPEILYDERKKNLDEFINAAGDISRGFRFKSGSIFSITAEAVTTALNPIVVGSVVELEAGLNFKFVASLTSGSTKVGTVIAIETVGTKTFYVIEVV